MAELPFPIDNILYQNHCSINTSIHLLDPLQKHPIFKLFSDSTRSRGISGLMLYEVDRMDNLGVTDLPLVMGFELRIFKKLIKPLNKNDTLTKMSSVF